MAQYELVFEDGNGQTFRVPVNERGLVIGRSVEADVRIDHPSVSRLHARLNLDQDKIALQYLGTRRGIKVNGTRVTSSELSHGDCFEAGAGTCTVVDLLRKTDVNKPKVPPTVLERNATNRLRMRRDPAIRNVFEQACLLSAQQDHPARLVSHALGLVLDLVDARRGFLLWFSNGDGVRVIGSLAQDGKKQGPKLNGNLIGTSTRLGAPMLKIDERPLPAEATGDRPAALCAPLKCNGHVVGAVYADSGWEDGEFTTHKLQDLRALIQVIGPSLVRIGSATPASN